jgi:ATP-dependent Clp protease ATP-binding subunit ClpA
MMQGRTVNFANCVIIMTSNLGSEYLLQAAATRPASPAEAASIGQLGQDAAKELVMAQVGTVWWFQQRPRSLMSILQPCTASCSPQKV